MDKKKIRWITQAKKIDIQTVKSVVSALFPDYWKQTDYSYCLSVVATLLLEKNANPTSLILIGPPAAGKTTSFGFLQR